MIIISNCFLITMPSQPKYIVVYNIVVVVVVVVVLIFVVVHIGISYGQ